MTTVIDDRHIRPQLQRPDLDGWAFKKVQTGYIVHTNVLVFCDTDKPNPLYCVPYL